MANSYSRYKIFTLNGIIISVPSIPIPSREEDRFVEYDINKTRLDRISAESYGDDSYWWVILMANPQYYFEFDIPTGTVIRVPFPLDQVLFDFQREALKFIK